MSVGQRNDRRSCCPHDVKRDGRNMRERTMVLLCRLGLLLMGERTMVLLCRLGLLLIGERTSGNNF